MYVAYGIAFALVPVKMALLITGGSPETASGLIDMRATYGGVTFAVGAIILLLGRHAATRAQALLVAAVVLAAMAIARAIGIVLDGDASGLMYLSLGAEIFGAVIAEWMRRKATVADSQ